MKAISQPVDIIWSFDLGDIYPFRFFPETTYKIFHPVDEPLNRTAIHSAKGADIIFSVTREILEKYKKFPAPKHFINHGLSQDFLLPVDKEKPAGIPVHVGFSGNLLRNDIDRDILLKIVAENQHIFFDFFGSYMQNQSNIGGVQDENVNSFIASLTSNPNVKLHGPVAHQKLAESLHQMDAFLICYDVKKDQSKGTNYHKVMEYISTGKVIVSNNITTYNGQSDLVCMVTSRENNSELPVLFKNTISQLNKFNSPALQTKRINYAMDNTYLSQIERVEKYICNTH